MDGTVPLYELFTGWQQARAQRQRLLAAAAQQQRQHQQQQPVQAQAQRVQQAPGRARVLAVVRSTRQAAPAASAGAAAVGGTIGQGQQQLRPIELFYAKLRVRDAAQPRGWAWHGQPCWTECRCSSRRPGAANRSTGHATPRPAPPCATAPQEAGIDPGSPREAWPLPKLVRVLESMQQTGGWPGRWAGSGGACTCCWGLARHQHQLPSRHGRQRTSSAQGSRAKPAPLTRACAWWAHPSCPPAVDRQLLWRELWLGAGGPADWWRRQRAFAASTAAMSMVRRDRGPRCVLRVWLSTG